MSAGNFCTESVAEQVKKTELDHGDNGRREHRHVDEYVGNGFQYAGGNAHAASDMCAA